MSALAVASDRPLGPRLVRAEVLKLATRRGLMVASLLLTGGGTIAVFAILSMLHATDPAHHRIVGGIHHLDDGMYSLTQLATVAAILIGATAGAGDLAAGLFCGLIVTGRPRWSLFAARIPGGLTLLLPMTAVAFGVLAMFSYVVPGSAATPSTTLLARPDSGSCCLGAWRTVRRDA